MSGRIFLYVLIIDKALLEVEILHLHLLEGGFGKQHGDVLIYNRQHHHGTTEFHLLDGDELSGRLFFAFFMKKDVLHADLLSQAVVRS